MSRQPIIAPTPLAVPGQNQVPAKNGDSTANASASVAEGRDNKAGDEHTGDGSTSLRSNFVWMSIYQITLRIGWIFKTESIIMPAFIDLIGGASWQRGCLPMLNRLGQSIPPLLISDRIRNVSQKKVMLCCSSMAMGVCFLLLAVCWWFSFTPSTSGVSAAGQQTAAWWWPWLFLITYAVFFTATGINQVLYGTLTGKLVADTSRGKLAAVGSLVGGGLAILVALWLLRPWLAGVSPRFGLIFGFTGAVFVLAGAIALRLQETVDVKLAAPNMRRVLGEAKSIFTGDPNFRILAFVGGTFGMSMTLFPHYQYIAREHLGIEYSTMLYWIIAQHIGASLASVPTGILADRMGNRIVLQILMGCICVPPLLLMVLSASPATSRTPYLILFFLLGLTPIMFRFFNHYAIETATRDRHPALLSTLSACIAMPVITTSTLIGALMSTLGTQVIFGGVLALLFSGWAATFLLSEPRHGRQTEGS